MLLSVGIVFTGKSAFRAAEDVNMLFIVRAVKEPGDEISFLGKTFFTNRAAPFNSFFSIRMAMRATKNMAKTVFFTGIQDGFKLFSKN